jgi:enoyl-CoA hydratase/carnithine racemase
MSEQDPILVERRGTVGWITINRPEHRNAIDQASRRLLKQAFEDLQQTAEIRVIVLTGVGTAFCAGVDLSDTADGTAPLHLGTRLVDPVERCELPVIAAVNGAAVGGGFELALASDLRVAAGPAFFQLTELRIGSLPGSGGTQRLFAAVPLAVAWRALATGERITSDRALHYGLVSDVFPEDDFENRVVELANKVASAAPLSLRAAKMAAKAATDERLATGLTLERALWSALSATHDRDEGRAAFREKREPDFRGR